MPSDDPNDRTSPAQFPGFHANADDTPRDAAGAPILGENPRREPPPAWTIAPETEPLDPPAATRDGRNLGKAAVAVGLAAALGAGVLLARSGGSATGPSRPTSEAAAMAAAKPMNVEVAAATPAPAPPPSSEKLEVLTPSAGVATSTQRYAERDGSQRFSPPPEPAPREPPRLDLAPPPPREVAQAPVARDADAVAPAPLRTGYDCRDAPTRAREMVCRDGRLAAMDRQMKQAYAAALASGVRRDALAADQDDWLEVREEAASYSRRAVADLYRQRIDELEAIARGR